MGKVSYFKRGRKKLSDEQIAEIRAAHGLGWEIAIRYGISAAQVSRIKNGKRRPPLRSQP